MIDLTDFTFCIPVSIDSDERQENLSLNLRYLTAHFNTAILVGEEDTEQRSETHGLAQHVFYKKDTTWFWRTRLLNRLFRQVKTRFVVNYDLDVFICTDAWQQTADILRRNFYSFVYPYNGIFYKCPRTFRERILSACITGRHLFSSEFQYASAISYGGAVAGNVDHYLASGGENENFKSWGAEDIERICRWQALQYQCTRVSEPAAVLYHLNHPTSADSSKSNPHFNANTEEYRRVQRMTTEQLQAYVKSWPWAKGNT